VLDYILLLYLITGSKHNGDALSKNRKISLERNKTKNRAPQKVNTKGGFFTTQITSKMCNIYFTPYIELPEF
jgi:hypothetical protein